MIVQSGLWIFLHLGTVPDCHNPDRFVSYAIEEPIRFYVDFAVGEFRKLHDGRSGFGEASEPLEGVPRLLPELPGRVAFIPPDRLDGIEELDPRGRSKQDVQA